MTTVACRSDTKPIYIVIARDPTTESGYQYYKVYDLISGTPSVTIKGFLLTIEEAAELKKTPYAKIGQNEQFEVNRIIPWQEIIRIDSVNYKKTRPQGEQ